MRGCDSLQRPDSSTFRRIGDGWDANALLRFEAAVHDSARVTGLTHQFYRYPARFSPQFARSAIQEFTQPGDLVFDPFVGGGTTLVEAIALGRKAVGTDISSLATFISTTKTSIFTDDEFRHIELWANDVPNRVNIHRFVEPSSMHLESGYLKHLDSSQFWRLRKAIEQVLASISALPTPSTKAFARCVALRTGQWALDGRKHIPSIDEFRENLREHARQMVHGARELRSAVYAHAQFSPTARCLNRTSIGIDRENPCEGVKPKLVLTSPPYPGVHVLYHRWQIDGRKETAAPFWIANQLDGSGESYYTLGPRRTKDSHPYFKGLSAAFSSIAGICGRDTIIIQIVAFSNPSLQLPRYLEVVSQSGFQEITLPFVTADNDGRLWRTIPNRKWHAERLGNIPASREVVLFHKKVSYS